MGRRQNLSEEEYRSKLKWEERRYRAWLSIPSNISVKAKLKILDEKVPFPEGEEWVEKVKDLGNMKR